MSEDSPDTIGSLRMFVWIVAQIIQDEGDLQPWHLESYLPGMVFNLAVVSRLLPLPPDVDGGDGVGLGDFRVDAIYRQHFIDGLRDVIEEVRPIAQEDGQNLGVVSMWIEPTPEQIIKRFRAERGFSFERIAVEARKLSDDYLLDVDDKAISYKTIRRMCKPGHNARPYIAKALARLMNLTDWTELQWRLKKSYRVSP